jgi:signal peptide peptidase SppA
VQSELIAQRITSLAKKHQIPVYSFVEEVAASGGYWLACMGDKIFATKSSIVGSIGVIYSNFGFDEAIKKLGIERRIFAEGKNKSVLDPFKPVKPSDVALIKNLGQNIHEHFINYVKTRRAGKLTQSDEILFNGEFWAGQTALDYGLIDGIDDMYSYINKHYGDDVRIEYIEGKQSWFKKKLGMTSSSQLGYEISDGLIDSIKVKSIEDRFNIS